MTCNWYSLYIMGRVYCINHRVQYTNWGLRVLHTTVCWHPPSRHTIPQVIYHIIACSINTTIDDGCSPLHTNWEYLLYLTLTCAVILYIDSNISIYTKINIIVCTCFLMHAQYFVNTQNQKLIIKHHLYWLIKE